jgi:hypothetical protein
MKGDCLKKNGAISFFNRKRILFKKIFLDLI